MLADTKRLVPGPRAALGSRNAFKLGLFAANCSGSRILSAAPENWSGTWEDNLKLAHLCDDVGLEFLVPVGRWKGYGGVPDHNGSTFETITWATGLLSATKRVNVFGTVHCPLFHPLLAAKMMVTADHAGSGRFGLNIVAGWNEDEFKMFGADLRDHENRYAFAQEWIDVVRTTWEQNDVDFNGEFFHLEGIRENPKPFGGTRPIVMNAGASATGRAYAIRNSDMFFTAVHLAEDLTPLRAEVAAAKADAAALGREIEIFSSVFVACRPTRAEAEEFVHYAIDEHPNWGAMEKLFEGRRRMARSEEAVARARANMPRALLGVAVIGDPDDVARGLAAYADAGLRGLVLTFINFNSELPYFAAEVFPRLEKLGLRQPG
jgi:alkanesulfonate monooxygenase SsuD/methylene tetrahydromethanopterin reductase-like flavin-dependent oxidoreductase (luciferase family)